MITASKVGTMKGLSKMSKDSMQYSESIKAKKPKNNDGVNVIKEIKAMQKEKRTQQLKDPLLFIKRLSALVFGLAILGLGLVALLNNVGSPLTIKSLAYCVSGSCAIVDGVYLLYVALMRVGRES